MNKGCALGQEMENRVIEKFFPVRFINNITNVEVHARKPIYDIHRWWARRPGSTFRAIILGTLLSGNSVNEESFKTIFYRKNDLNGSIVLDPFSGGGTTIVEAARLNCNTIGIDINPVAWFITKKEIEQVSIKRLIEEYRNLEKKLAHKIKRYYITSCPNCGKPAEVVYAFWVRRVRCSRCGTEFPKFSAVKLADINRDKSWIFCLFCHTIFAWNRKEKNIICPGCGRQLDIDRKTRDKKYSCPGCGAVLSAKESLPTKNFDMIAIEYYCPNCGRRGYKAADASDYRLYEEAKKEFYKHKDNLIFPREEIPPGKEVKRLFKYGYKFFYEFFNERQLLCLSILFDEILHIEDDNIKEFFLLAFSDCLDYNNMFARYNWKARKIEPMFAHHAFYPKDIPAENNVWGARYGRCSFSKCFKKLVKAKQYCNRPYELRVIGGKADKIYIQNEKIRGNFVDNFKDLSKGGGNVLLKCHDAEDLSFIPDKSVDAVITDPPYFDNVMYSELADFYYIWLRIALAEKYDIFKQKYCPRSGEAVVNKVQRKDEGFYLQKLTKIFKECFRVLKDNGLLVFTFHHKKIEAWASTLEAILNANFYITAVYPVFSEMRTSFHIFGKKAVSYDTIIVCRKRKGKLQRISWDNLLDEIESYAKEMLKELTKFKNLTPDDLFVIMRGKCLELYSKFYPNVYMNEEKVSIAQVLDYVDKKLAELMEKTDAFKKQKITLDEFMRNL